MPKKLPDQPVKKNTGCFFKIILGVVGLLIFGRYINFAFDFPYFDILHYTNRPMTFEEVMEIMQPVAPKGYTYPPVPQIARDRIVDCSVIYAMNEFPRKNPICLNIFRTSPDEISELLSNHSYDRIVLYGERSVFDAPASEKDSSFIKNVYNTVRFMDQIALPKFLEAYGLADVSYIKTKPYSYLYYRLSSDEDLKIGCPSSEGDRAQGCAKSFYVSVIPLFAVGPQLSNAKPILRRTDNKRFSYITQYPSDCFTNDVFAHETSHMLNIAGMSETYARVMDSWFTEQIAGFFSIFGDDLACGDGTIRIQKKKEVTDVPKALVEFNAVFASASLSHDYPENNVCRQALLTQWYKFLSKGNYRENFRKFFVEQRRSTPSIVDDSVFAKFLLRLDPDSSTKTFLTSKGCSF